MMTAGERLAVALVLSLGLSALPGCQRDVAGLTEWTPADHDHQVQPRRRRSLSPTAQANPHAPPSQRNQVIDVTWAKQCASCHGRRGRGDGPSSMMVKAKDLTTSEWQASVSDEQIAKVIRQGRDKMPAFNLPDSIIEGLVEHVRNLGEGRDRQDRPGADEEEEAEEQAAHDAPAAAPNVPASAGAASPPGTAPAEGAPADTRTQSPTGAAAGEP